MGRRTVNLRSELFWSIVLIALITVTVVGSLLHVAVVQAIRQGIEDEQALLAHQVGRLLEASLLHTVSDLRTAARDPSFLTFLVESHSQAERAYAVNKAGVITASVVRSSAGPSVATPADLGFATRYFESGGLFYLTTSPETAPEAEAVVLVTVPQLAQGKPAGLLAAELSAHGLVGVVTGLSDNPGVGVYVLQGDGRFVGPERSPRYRRLPDPVLARAARTPVGEAFTTIVEDSLVTVMRVPWTGWLVVVREATDVALNPVRLARWAFFVLTPLALLIAAFLAFRQAAWISGDETRRIEQLAVAVVEAQENERRRIAQDIHDWTAQRLTSSYYHVQLLERLLPKDPAAVERELPQLASALNSANIELREIMRNLHPHLLTDLGLAAAVKGLVADFARKAGLEYEVEVTEGAPEPPAHVATALFRILQEALSNVEKHAHARRVEVVLRLYPGQAIVLVSDDGTGFDPEATPTHLDQVNGLGLSGMRERTELLGGYFRLVTTPGQGTTVEVSIPWNQ